MGEFIQPLNRYYQDQNGVIVHVTGYDHERQCVIYRRPGDEWVYAAPKIVFRSRFRRIDK